METTLPSALSTAADRRFSSLRYGVVLLMFLGSGTAGLIYEVLWMKELGLLFGNTTHAAATTLAAFFLGLTVGGLDWGRRAAKLTSPLHSYAMLELAVAISAIGYFVLLPLYHHLYPTFFSWFGNHASLFVLLKFLLAMLVLFPTAYFIGGTLPVMSQYVVRNMNRMGHRVSVLYAINTFGASLGVLLAGFYLPMALGFRNAYLFAIAITTSVALWAFWLARGDRAAAADPSPLSATGSPAWLGLDTLRLFAFLSGLVSLALQVLWTRMFSQVLQNSVYTFASVLLVFLLGLATGALVAHLLIRSRHFSLEVLFAVLALAALWVAMTPFVFTSWTNGLNYVGGDGWGQYLWHVFLMELVVMGPAVVLIGAVFPLLLKLAEPHDISAGRLVGNLAALNTAGGIIGSLAAGFIILNYVGLWSGIRLLGIVYFLAALHLVYRFAPDNKRLLVVAMGGVLVLVSLLDTSRLPLVQVDFNRQGESLVEVWEGSAGTVAVVRSKDSLKTKVNNHYTLGGSRSRSLESLQGYLPVVLHPSAQSVYMLGLGTGISAGATLHAPLKKLVVTELLPEAVTASRKYFSQYNNQLFKDPRAEVIVEDGRNYLAGSSEKFDVITADLFIPWKAGSGSLYTLEHYQSVGRRLQEGGLFMQWLPAYQLSRDEFATIAQTMLQVFPRVTVWRGDFSVNRPIVGLMGQMDEQPLSPKIPFFPLDAQADKQKDTRVPTLAQYVGNLQPMRAFFAKYPVNRDDRPIIEYRTPITQRSQGNKEGIRRLAGKDLIDFMAMLQKRLTPQTDPFLERIPAALRQLPLAGLSLHRAKMLEQRGQQGAADKEQSRYRHILTQLQQDGLAK